MIEDIHHDKDDPSFMRHWAERVWDQAQLAQIAAIEESMVVYAMTAWRPMSIPPPTNRVLLCVGEIGVVLLTMNDLGEWRDLRGPHKPPRAWMPCPTPPTGESWAFR